MPKSDLPIGGDYAPVADRIALFYERFPSGRIMTDLITRDDRDVVFRATVYRTERSRVPAATGWASERMGDGDVNTVACVENTETSAVGRALANLGFTASRNRPSAEEMAKVSRARTRILVREVSNSFGERSRLQTVANEITETLNLLAAAESYGMRKVRVERTRARLLAGAVPPEGQRRIRQLLRDWLAKQRRRREQASSRPTPREASP